MKKGTPLTLREQIEALELQVLNILPSSRKKSKGMINMIDYQKILDFREGMGMELHFIGNSPEQLLTYEQMLDAILKARVEVLDLEKLIASINPSFNKWNFRSKYGVSDTMLGNTAEQLMQYKQALQVLKPEEATEGGSNE